MARDRGALRDRWVVGKPNRVPVSCRGASTGRDWTTEIARATHDKMSVLGRSLRVAGLISVNVPAALGWDAHPPLVCTSYIGGTDVFFLLADRTHPGWAGTGRQPIEVLETCGRALGA